MLSEVDLSETGLEVVNYYPKNSISPNYAAEALYIEQSHWVKLT